MRINNIIESIKYKFIWLLLLGAVIFAACNKEKEEDPFVGKDSYIAAFSLQRDDAVFQAAIAGSDIIVTAPEGFSLNSAKATVQLSENATIYPDPATITSWEEEQLFAVTAHDGTQTRYKYTVARSGIAYTGTVFLKTQADVDDFGQRGITFIDGNLIIGRATGTDSIRSLAPLASLKEVTFSLTLNATCAVSGLEELENLERVDGTLQIGGATAAGELKHLETLTLPALKTAGGISLVSTVTIIAEFPKLERVSKLFSLNCPLFQLRLPSLQSAGSLTLTTASNSNAMLAKISFPALKEAGTVNLSYFAETGRIEFPELKKVVGDMAFSRLPQLLLIYVPQLKEVSGNLNFSYLTALTELNFPVLKYLGGDVAVTSCALLKVQKFPEL
jgi:hypothetical protein